MKVKVVKSFYDKYTCEFYEVGKIIEVKTERAKELLSDSRELVVKVEPKSKKKGED